MASIALQNIVKDYGDVRAVDGIDLEINDGEFVAFVGPSGCGKSTLLRMIAGLEEITQGTASIGNRVVNSIEPRGRNVAMVFQDYALYPHMTVAKNIGFGLKMRGVNEAETSRRVGDAAQMLQIEKLLERKPGELSGGQRQRVAMGRAIVRKPAVFLFDEPLSNLDAKLRVDMRTQIKRLHSILNTTMVYVTHDQIEAMTLADRIVLLREGRIEQQGKPVDLYTTPRNRFVAEFIGSPQMNILDATLAGSDREPAVQIGSQFLSMDSCANPIVNQVTQGQVMLGIRPEHFILDEKNGGFQATVVLIEPTGSDTLVLCSADDQELTIRIPADYPVSVGQCLQFSVAAQRIHIFDKESGARLNT